MIKLFMVVMLFILTPMELSAVHLSNKVSHIKSNYNDLYQVEDNKKTEVEYNCERRFDPKECYRLGRHYLSMNKAVLEGIIYLQKSCVGGYGKACRDIGNYYLGNNFNPQMSKKYFEKGCNENDYKSCINFNHYFLVNRNLNCLERVKTPEKIKKCKKAYKDLYLYHTKYGFGVMKKTLNERKFQKSLLKKDGI